MWNKPHTGLGIVSCSYQPEPWYQSYLDSPNKSYKQDVKDKMVSIQLHNRTKPKSIYRNVIKKKFSIQIVSKRDEA